MEVFFARFVEKDLVDWLAKETFIKAANEIVALKLVDNLDKVTLLQQPDGILHTFGRIRAFRERWDLLQSLHLELFTQDRGSFEEHYGGNAAL